MVESPVLNLVYDKDAGLQLTWAMPNGLTFERVPVRAAVRGTGAFFVWGEGDADALAPVWAEKDFALTCFGGAAESPGTAHTVERLDGQGFRAVARHARAAVTLELRLADGRLVPSLEVSCPREGNGRPLPLAAAELRFENLCVGAGAVFETAHHYGGGVHGYGAIADLKGRGHAFANGCLGLALPLVFLHHPATGHGLELEFLTDGRPLAWLRPGVDPESATWALAWSPERLLQPGQSHVYAGGTSLAPFSGRPVEAARRWRDAAASRYGLRPPTLPAWARNANLIEYDMRQPPERAKRGLTDMLRADDPRWRACLAQWRDMGYNVLYLIASNPTGRHSLSPLSYAPAEAIGGAEAEKGLLDLAHELGYRVVLWVTTVGLDMDAPEVKAHGDWWVWKPSGLPYCPFGDYAADADPLSAGWRQWLVAQVTAVIARGYDGIFVDGLTPRDSNRARWAWPGEARNAVQDLVRDLAAHVHAQRDGTLVFIEDENVNMQAAAGFTCGRYQPGPPKLKRYWAGIGMPFAPDHPSTVAIAAEQVRDYLAMRYASLLPGAVSCDMIEGYYSDASRVWTAQALLAGCAVKTFSTSVNEPETFELIHDIGMPPEAERSPEHRRCGHAEFCELLRFCRAEPLLRQAAVSLDGVVIAGDAAVVGLLHASEERCILALVQFAARPATVQVRLAAPDDVPAVSRAGAGQPQRHAWQTHEVLRAMTEPGPLDDGQISATQTLAVPLQPYGYRVLELRK